MSFILGNTGALGLYGCCLGIIPDYTHTHTHTHMNTHTHTQTHTHTNTHTHTHTHGEVTTKRERGAWLCEIRGEYRYCCWWKSYYTHTHTYTHTHIYE